MGQLISLFGKTMDHSLVEKILEEAIEENGSLLSGIFTESWGGVKRAAALYSKVASSVALQKYEPKEYADETFSAVEAAAPMFLDFLERAVSEKLYSMMQDPERARVNYGLMSAAKRAPLKKGEAAIKEYLEMTEEWADFKNYMLTEFPIKNAEVMLENQLSALSESLSNMQSMSSKLRGGSSVSGRGDQGVSSAFAAIGNETMEMYKDEVHRIKEIALRHCQLALKGA